MSAKKAAHCPTHMITPCLPKLQTLKGRYPSCFSKYLLSCVFPETISSYRSSGGILEIILTPLYEQGRLMESAVNARIFLKIVINCLSYGTYAVRVLSTSSFLSYFKSYESHQPVKCRRKTEGYSHTHTNVLDFALFELLRVICTPSDAPILTVRGAVLAYDACSLP